MSAGGYLVDFSWFFSASAFAVAMGATSGPNNTMLAASGANYGFRGTFPHFLGVSLGFPTMFLVVAFLGKAFLADPMVHGIMKWLGVAYLLWLAFAIATAKPKAGGSEDVATRPLTFWQAALFQWINPKAWIIVAGAIATYTLPGRDSTASSLVLATILLVVSLMTSAGWTAIGVGVSRVLATPGSLRFFNWTMAALLVASLIPIILD
jgi:threonine/homoserine/homoserine lactone efflux protein